MEILLRLWQAAKAELPIEVTVSGMVMLVRFVQLWKLFDPMEVTVSGRTMLERFEQAPKALRAMEETGSPSIFSGISREPVAAVSHSVMVTSLSLISQVRSLRSAALTKGARARRQKMKILMK